MRRWTAPVAIALLAGITLSGCYALDPEMRRIVAERKAKERAAKAAAAEAKTAPQPPPVRPAADAPLPAAPVPPGWPGPAPRVDAAEAAQANETLKEVAAAYLILTLEAGAHEQGYVDAYYGPPKLIADALTAPRGVPVLEAEARRLIARIDGAVPGLGDPIDRRRAAFLHAQLVAAETRLQMMQGKRFPFAEEAERLFGVRPVLKPLAAYDAELAKVAALVPGDGPLAARVEAYLDRFTIPKDRLEKVFDAAIARCRGRTAAHVAMPESEAFTRKFVTGKSWSGYNHYVGAYNSIIEINTDLPIRLSRALDLGCHEGYPGHHLLNMKVEEQLVKGRGWLEFSVYPLYSPQSLIAEGTANYGIDLAFPDKTRPDTERDVLMPLAEIEPPANDRYWRLLDAMKALQGARLTIAQRYLDGEIDRPAAVALTQKYLLVSPARAEQSVAFTDQYRSYVINYVTGEEMVRDFLERGSPDRDEIWRRFALILGEPTLPADLLAP
ncbi:hypothetical protein [Sphingopyxis panaciterrulae]|uniref:DUF885 domain-containing protein n=1 Tax=Sphingopyxis panaciterrulae TaxID=462372 RepID=A0A7W9ER34_9SPHN|nr:hypothetical protein [Sphingopyxis panaciterrulae]MBB5705466.1 hypothetical protein [Sphingopyxis panaciterrulae]